MHNTILVSNIPITDLLADILGPVVEKLDISTSVAKCLATSDPDERYCHIEYHDNKCTLWRISEWRNDYARQQKKRELYALERQVNVLVTEHRLALARKLSAQLGVAQEMLLDAAHTLLASRNPRVLETFGLDITELLKAQEAVNEFKKNK